MKDQVYRVVISNFKESSVSREDINLLLESVEQIENKTIRSRKELMDLLKDLGMDKKTFQDTVSEIIEKGAGSEVISLVSGLGQNKGLGILSNSWVARNVSDARVLKNIRPSDWYLFRDDKWLETNKVTKD